MKYIVLTLDKKLKKNSCIKALQNFLCGKGLYNYKVNGRKMDTKCSERPCVATVEKFTGMLAARVSD